MREQRQQEFADKWLQGKQFGILNLCPRFGKINVAIKILKKGFSKDAKVLIAYPDIEIKKSWISDFKKFGYVNKNVVFSTHMSLKKLVNEQYDLIIIDEIHLLSEAQIKIVQQLNINNKKLLGLTGTLSKWTQRTLSQSLGLGIDGYYSMEQAITEGVVPDYQITILKVSLDNKQYIYPSKKGDRTEKKQFDVYSYVINKLVEEEKDVPFTLRLTRMRIIQNSIAKIQATRKLLADFKDERVLVFCGLIKTAEKLGCPTYHSNSVDYQIFNDFIKGIGNHCAVVKIGNTGITYKPLNRVIVNYFDSNSENLAQKINRCMSWEYGNPNKKADIWIISTTEQVENEWLKSALEFFDKSKIKIIET